MAFGSGIIFHATYRTSSIIIIPVPSDSGIFGGMMDKFKAIRKLLGLGKETVDAGASAMEDTKTPLSTMTSNSISNSATSQNANNVSVQGITINTAATDADGISKDIGGSLEKQMQRVLYQNYSGAVA